MQYRKLGKSGCEVSNLSFGCMRLPLRNCAGGHASLEDIDETKSVELIHYAIDQGVNYFDTAYPYHEGKSEPLLGKAVAGQREKIMLATKLPIWMVRSRESFYQFLEEQLQRLNTPYLDFYLLHALNALLWPKMKELGALEFLDRMVADGRVRHVGFSFHDDLQLFREIVDSYDWDMCQIQYNYLDWDFQAGTEGLKYAASKGLGVVIMEPLRGGTLTNAIPAEVQAVWNTAPRKKSPAEWALSWLWNQPEVGTVLSSMNSSEQLRENLRIADAAQPNSLSSEELALIARATETYRAMYKVNCTSCGYCLPCPQGVNIPFNFRLYNDIFLFHNLESCKMIYNRFTSPPERASNCSECGECEQHCPQHISIAAELKNVQAALKA